MLPQDFEITPENLQYALAIISSRANTPTAAQLKLVGLTSQGISQFALRQRAEEILYAYLTSLAQMVAELQPKTAAETPSEPVEDVTTFTGGE